MGLVSDFTSEDVDKEKRVGDSRDEDDASDEVDEDICSKSSSEFRRFVEALSPPADAAGFRLSTEGGGIGRVREKKVFDESQEILA